MKSLIDPTSRSRTRRALLTSALGTAIGASTIAGLVVYGAPRLLVVGEKEWQVALLLSARTRVLILNGEVTPDAVRTIPMLLSVMRQRIDVVIGSSASLAVLPAGFRDRWMVRRTVPLPDEGDSPTRGIALNQVLHLSDTLQVEVAGSPRGMWTETSGDIGSVAAGVVTISNAGNVISMGRNLQTVATLGAPSTAIAIAPSGRIDHVLRHMSAPTICINADRIGDQKISSVSSQDGPAPARSLVRIFPRDIAEFKLRAHGITIPEWRSVISTV